MQIAALHMKNMEIIVICNECINCEVINDRLYLDAKLIDFRIRVAHIQMKK